MAGVAGILGRDAAFGVSVSYRRSRASCYHCVLGIRQFLTLVRAVPFVLAVGVMDDAVPCAAAMAGACSDDFIHGFPFNARKSRRHYSVDQSSND